MLKCLLIKIIYLKYIQIPATELAEAQNQGVTSKSVELEPKVEESKQTVIIPEPISTTNAISDSQDTVETDDFETEEISEDVVEDEEENLVENAGETEESETTNAVADYFDSSYIEETRFEVKPTLWQRIKNSKLFRTISYIMKIRVVLDYPALPEGNIEK